MAEKNMIIALILSFLITGLGLAYDGLYVRFIVALVIGILITLITNLVTFVFSIVSFIWFIYVLYDTYQCTNAINNNQTIPKFLTKFDLQ